MLSADSARIAYSEGYVPDKTAHDVPLMLSSARAGSSLTELHVSAGLWRKGPSLNSNPRITAAPLLPPT
eukprot:5761220-Amphidinium_carterae.1